MADDAYGATIAKRRLSRRLTELRRASGHTANYVCDMLSWGRGKVGRFEANQWKRPEMSDIRDLLRIYGATDEVHDEIIDLAERAKVKGWWRDYADVFDNEFAGFENDASRIRVCMPLVLPGLLQTRDYMEGIQRGGFRSPAWYRRSVDARLRRQEILGRTGDTTPKLVAVITEASLMYEWGTNQERREQIEHLIETSRRPNVELHIQRFCDGPPRGPHSMLNIFDFADDEPRVVYLESDYAIEEITTPGSADAYIEAFDQARHSALEPSATTCYLSHLVE